MANGFRRSRSPVRAITSIHHPGQDPLRRSPRTDERLDDPGPLAAARPVASAAGPHALSCPECGSTLQLRLQTAPPHPFAGHPGGGRELRAATEPDRLPDFESTVKDCKRRLISRALEQNAGVMTRAAEALGLKYTTFVAMAHRLGVTNKNGGEGDDEES